MALIEFAFSVREDQGSPHQFDLGDMFVRGEGGIATSEGHVPDQGMMIHVAVAGLLELDTPAGDCIAFTARAVDLFPYKL